MIKLTKKQKKFYKILNKFCKLCVPKFNLKEIINSQPYKKNG